MPKIKTRSAVAKRFNIPKSAQLEHAQIGRRHKLTTTSTKRKRQLRSPAYGATAIEANIRKMMPYA